MKYYSQAVKDGYSPWPGHSNEFKETWGFMYFKNAFSIHIQFKHIICIKLILWVNVSNVSTLTSYYSNWAVTHHHLWTIYPGCELQHWGANNLYQFKCSMAHVWPSRENSICPTSRVSKDAKASWLLPLTLEVPVTLCSFVQRHVARPTWSPHRSQKMDSKEASSVVTAHSPLHQVHSVLITSRAITHRMLRWNIE